MGFWFFFKLAHASSRSEQVLDADCNQRSFRVAGAGHRLVCVQTSIHAGTLRQVIYSSGAEAGAGGADTAKFALGASSADSN